MGESSKPRSSSRLSSEEYERRRKGGGKSSSSSSSNHHHHHHKSSSSGSNNRHHSSSKSHHGSSTSNRSRSSRRDEEDAEAKRKVRESLRSSRSSSDTNSNPALSSIRSSGISSGVSSRAEQDREAKRRARDSTRSSISASHRSSTSTRGGDNDDKEKERVRRSTTTNTNIMIRGVMPGAYTSSSVDMTGPKTARGFQAGHPLSFESERSSESLDLLESGGNFLTMQEIDDQRTKLTSRSSTTSSSVPSKPGAVPRGGRPSSSKPSLGSFSLNEKGGSTAPSRQSHDQPKFGSRPPQNASSSASSAPPAVRAMPVEDMEDERVSRLEEQNSRLQREMEDIRRTPNATIVHAEEAIPPKDADAATSAISKRTCMIIGFVICLAIAVGGGVAAAMLAGGGNENDDSSSAENPSVPNVAPTLAPNNDNGPTTLSPIEESPSNGSPSADDCLAMSKGLEVFNQTNFIDKNFTVGLDVGLSLQTSVGELQEILEDRLQEHLVPALAGCEDDNVSQRRRFLGDRRRRRRLRGNSVIGNGIANLVCDAEASCRTLDAGICYQCLLDLQLFLKADVSGLTLSISEIVQQDLMELLKLGSPFVDVKAFSVLAVELTPVPSNAPTPAPVASCPATSDYFEGPSNTETSLVKGRDYGIGCGGNPMTVFVIIPDENSCVKCVGILPSSEYGTQCDEVGSINFQIAKGSITWDVLYYGYMSSFSENTLLSSCPDDGLMLTEHPGGGGGGGGGPGPTPGTTPPPTPGPTPPPTSAPVSEATPPPTSAPVSEATPPPTSAPNPEDTPPPTSTPISEPTPTVAPIPQPTPAPVACPATIDYFEGPSRTDTLTAGKDYTIGCGGHPMTLFALIPDENSCIKCVGKLTESDYGYKCPDNTGGITFQISGATSDVLYYGYVSTFSENEILSSCPDGTMTVVATSGGGAGGGGSPPSDGGGNPGGGGGGGGGQRPPPRK